MSYKLKIICDNDSFDVDVSENGIKGKEKYEVCDNKNYRFELSDGSGQPIEGVKVRINKPSFDEESSDDKKLNTFEGYFGRIIIYIRTENGIILKSPPISVTLNDTTQAMLFKMIEFIIKKAKETKFPGNVYELFGIKDGGNQEFFTTDVLIKKILDVYEQNYRHFFNNSRVRLVEQKVVGSIERLRGFSSDTVRFIVSHPGYLAEEKEETQIVVDGKYFMPRKTLVSVYKKSFNIAENRYILGFLKHIKDFLGHNKESQGNMLDFFDMFTKASEGTGLGFEGYDELVESCDRIYDKYKRAFENVQDEIVDALPPMTHIFKSVYHYNNIYKYMRMFFERRGAIDIADPDKVIWHLETSSKIYEYYLFYKLDEKIIEKGYDKILPSKDCALIPERVDYKKGKERKYLYYQPKILFVKSLEDDKGIHLRRNTKISLSGFDSGEPYCPDYIIKSVDAKGNEVYEIADAKFSDFETVRDYYKPQVAFKYLLSVHAINGKISGLKLYYCKGNRKKGSDETINETIRDPYIEIISLE